MADWFSWMWGKPPQKYAVVSTQETIEKSLDSVEALQAKRMHLMKKSSDMLQEARELKKKGDKKKAMEVMRRRQQIETMANQLEGQILNMEKTSFMLESTATTVDLAKTMKDGSRVMQTLLKEVTIDDIDTIADDLDDAMISSHEVAEALARPLGGQNYVSDSELMNDLMESSEEDNGNDIVASMPSIPESIQKRTEKKTEKNNIVYNGI